METWHSGGTLTVEVFHELLKISSTENMFIVIRCGTNLYTRCEMHLCLAWLSDDDQECLLSTVLIIWCIKIKVPLIWFGQNLVLYTNIWAFTFAIPKMYRARRSSFHFSPKWGKSPTRHKYLLLPDSWGLLGSHSALEEQIQSICEATPGSYLYGQIGEWCPFPVLFLSHCLDLKLKKGVEWEKEENGRLESVTGWSLWSLFFQDVSLFLFNSG